jgi:hypothetical protein
MGFLASIFNKSNDNPLSVKNELLVKSLIATIHEITPKAVEYLNREFETLNAEIENQNLAIAHCFAAFLAYEIIAILNSEQGKTAEAIIWEIRTQLFKKSYGKPLYKDIFKYMENYQEGHKKGQDLLKSTPSNEFAAQIIEAEKGIEGNFIRNILGKNIKPFLQEYNGETVISLSVMMLASSLFAEKVGVWKNLNASHSELSTR